MRGRTQVSLIGQRFGRLVVTGQVDPEIRPSGKKVYKALVRCDCGTEKLVAKAVLGFGRVKSCGCLRREVAAQTSKTFTRKHGESSNGPCPTAEYHAWTAMNARCRDVNHPAFKYYGGRGIGVCEKWKVSYAAFVDDVGRRPSPFHSLDRYPNNDGDYEPGNVRWATKTEQSANRRLPGPRLKKK
jgi:hypothetical protein